MNWLARSLQKNMLRSKLRKYLIIADLDTLNIIKSELHREYQRRNKYGTNN